MSKMDKRRKGFFGPPIGKLSIVFIDDMNMPAQEVYGAQPPIELLRQFLDHRHWYDLKDTTKVVLQDTQFIFAMGPPGGGRNPVTIRMMRHLNIIAINPFNDATMIRIFNTIINTFLKVVGLASPAVQLLNQSINQNLYSTSSRSLLEGDIVLCFMWMYR